MTDVTATDGYTADPRIGMVLQDRYRIVRLLGVGGMGAVYEGEHLLIKRRVAIKCLHSQFAQDEQVDEPVEFTDQTRQKHYGGVYDDERIVDAIKLAFVSAGGRVAAAVTGYPAGAYMNHMLLTDEAGQLLLKDEEAGSSHAAWYTAHPTDERALVGEGADLLEMDLRTQEKTRLGPRPIYTAYLLLDGHERILTVDRPTETVRIFAYEAGQALPEEPLFEHKLPTRHGADFAPFGNDAFLLPAPTDDGLTYELVRLSEPTKGTVEMNNEGRLVTDPEVYATRWYTRTRGGVHHILVADGWYVL